MVCKNIFVAYSFHEIRTSLLSRGEGRGNEERGGERSRMERRRREERGEEGRRGEVHWWILQQFDFSILWGILNIKHFSNITLWSLSCHQWTSIVFPWFVGRLLYNWSFCETKIIWILPLPWYPHSTLLNICLFAFLKPILWNNSLFLLVRKGVLIKIWGKKNLWK